MQNSKRKRRRDDEVQIVSVATAEHSPITDANEGIIDMASTGAVQGVIEPTPSSEVVLPALPSVICEEPPVAAAGEINASTARTEELPELEPSIICVDGVADEDVTWRVHLAPFAPEPSEINAIPLVAEERRNGARIVAEDKAVRFAAEGWARTVRAPLRDLSEGGLYLYSSILPAIGSRVACGFFIRHDNDRDAIVLDGKVMRHGHDAFGRATGVGVAFQNVDPKTRDLLRRLMLARVRGDNTQPYFTRGAIDWFPAR